ncbi:acyl carrier protein [Rhizobium sp. LCM 4573]|uniref:acyl carrier protein n=1 Tax=Rhizobium sp. LCM 4573 TaxID=1848291 RepID=UPI0008D999A0|nr:acyl carrier protein [Rhizobium sp. LCM 4573]OHV76883.1 acyl carrier protein [Rhizobium sp. LCM 4573]
MADIDITTANRIKSIIADQLGVSPEEVIDNARLADDLGADSLEIAQIVIVIEEEFGIEVQNDVAENLVTVADAIDFVNAAVKEQGSSAKPA